VLARCRERRSSRLHFTALAARREVESTRGSQTLDQEQLRLGFIAARVVPASIFLQTFKGKINRQLNPRSGSAVSISRSDWLRPLIGTSSPAALASRRRGGSRVLKSEDRLEATLQITATSGRARVAFKGYLPRPRTRKTLVFIRFVVVWSTG
jgi:hypothetical protein